MLASCNVMVAVAPVGAATVDAKRSYDLPSGDAAKTLRQFAAASGCSLVFVTDKVRGEITNAVRGDFAPQDALKRMLAGSTLEAAQDAATGAFVVRRKRIAESAPRSGEVGPVSNPQPKPVVKPMKSPRTVFAALVGWLAFNSTSEAQSNGAEAAQDAVMLSPFEVTSGKAHAFQAANAVTASRFGLPILDTPMAINVVTEDFMNAIGARNALESLSYVSGITEGGGSPIRLEGSTVFNIRGVSTSFTLRDGIKNYGINDSYNVQRWEVLKGIVGMMYGDRNLGGLVNAVTKKPSDKAAYEISVRTDSWGSERATVDLTGPLNKNRTLNYRLLAFQKHEKTFMDYEVLRSHGYTASLEFKPFPGTRIFAEYEFYSQNNTLASKLVFMRPARSPRFANDLDWPRVSGYAPQPLEYNYAGPEAYLNETNRIRTVTFDQRLAAWLNFRSYASYAVRPQYRLNRDGGSTYEVLAPNDAPRQVFDLATGVFRAETAADSRYVISGMNSNLREFTNWDFIWRNDLLADYTLGGIKFKSMLGYEIQEGSGDFKSFDSYSPVTLDGRNPYAATQVTADGRGRVNFDLRTFDPRSPMPTRQEIWARRISDKSDTGGSFNGSTNNIQGLYAVQYAQFGKAFPVTIMAGIRQDRSRTEKFYTYARDIGARIYAATGFPTHWNVRNSPQAGVSIRLTKDVSMYATWSDVLVAQNTSGTIFQDELTQDSVTGVWSRTKVLEHKAQTGTNKEIGLKTAMLDGRLSTTAAVFYTTLANKPYAVGRTDPTNSTLRSGQSQADVAYSTLAGEEVYKGFEIDINYAVQNNWSVIFSYALTDAKVTKDSATNTFDTDPAPGAQNQTVYNLLGGNAGNIPRQQFRLYNSYSFTSKDGLFQNAGLGLGIRRSGRSQLTNGYNGRLWWNPAYTISDLSIWKRASVFGRSVSFTFRVNNILDKRYNSTRQIFGDPRNFALEARTKF